MSWTEEDYKSYQRERGAAVFQDAQKKLPSPLSSKKQHKFRAEPCIVTADLTLFTTADVERLEITSLDKRCPADTLKRRASRVGITGLWFGSLKEARRYVLLKQLEDRGAIRDLQLQVPYPCIVNGVTLGRWLADFVYEEPDGDAWVIRVEDTKGMKLDLYLWKRKHVQAQYSITILET